MSKIKIPRSELVSDLFEIGISPYSEQISSYFQDVREQVGTR